MSQIDKNLTSHSLVIIVNSRQRGIALKNLFTKLGFEVSVTLSLYDGLQIISQEMPHLVICESNLSDGSAASLFDRLNQHPVLKKTPILVNIVTKKKAEIQDLAQKKFAGFFIGASDAKTIVSKVNQILATFSNVSPYFLDFKQENFEIQSSLKLSGQVLGQSNDQIIISSSMEIDGKANFLGIPQNNKFSPAIFRMATNSVHNDVILNLFPLSRVMGKGRLWLNKVKEINLNQQADPETGEKKKVILFYDQNENRYNKLAPILKGYGYDSYYASSLPKATAEISSRPEDFYCVYLDELTNSSKGIEWKIAVSKVAANKKPPIIVGTTSINSKSTNEYRYIKKPFGIGTLLDVLESCELRQENMESEIINQNQQGIDIIYQTPAKLIGLDEMGGILELAFPLVKDCKVVISNPTLKSLWSEEREVRITNSIESSQQKNRWLTRFESIAAGMSKTKYWSQIISKVQNTDLTKAGEASSEKEEKDDSIPNQDVQNSK